MNHRATDVFLALQNLFGLPSVGNDNTSILSRPLTWVHCSNGMSDRTLPKRWAVIDWSIGDAVHIALIDRRECRVLILDVECQINQWWRRHWIQIFVIHAAADLGGFHGRHRHVCSTSHCIIEGYNTSWREVSHRSSTYSMPVEDELIDTHHEESRPRRLYPIVHAFWSLSEDPDHWVVSIDQYSDQFCIQNWSDAEEWSDAVLDRIERSPSMDQQLFHSTRSLELTKLYEVESMVAPEFWHLQLR